MIGELPKLSPRLLAIAEMVPKCQLLGDVGTDHGKLPLYLIRIGRVDRAIATDISSNSLDKLRSVLVEDSVADQIECIVSDGLLAFQQAVPDVVVIAGMGGKLIMDMFQRAPGIRDRVQRFILQPNTNESELRSFLHQQGLRIEDETCIWDAGHFYQILSVVKGEERYEKQSHYLYGYLNLTRQNPTTLQLLDSEYARYSEIQRRLEEQGMTGEKLDRIKQHLHWIEEAYRHYETE